MEDVINMRVALKLDAAVAEAIEKKRGEALDTSSAAEMSATREFLESAVNVSRSMHEGDPDVTLPGRMSPLSGVADGPDSARKSPLSIQGEASPPRSVPVSPFGSTSASPVGPVSCAQHTPL